jgi:DNA helicase-2/ATP-dependent DNA helicase PcrA
MTLNPTQETAVKECGIQLVLAGPGSGKTRVITEKVLHLVSQGISPQHILALTFSEKAASEMLERLEGKVDTTHLFVGTFHAFCLEMLEDNVLDSGISFHGGVISRANQLVWGLAHIDEFGFEHIEVGNNVPGVIESIIDGISAFRDELITPDELEAYLAKKKGENVSDEEREYLDKLSDLLKVYRAYEKYKRSANLLDYDDMIHEAVVLLSSKPHILNRYRKQYTHILVDEFQDTNFAQARLVRLLSGENVCVVGDDDQTIYRFRGAYLTNFKDFREQYKACSEILLSHNYRNSQTILTLALELMKHAPNRQEKELLTQNPPGDPVIVAECETEEAEVAFVLSEIDRLLMTPYSAGGSDRLYAHRDFAIICRRRAEGVKYYRALKHKGIPVEFVGEVEFFEAKVIRNLLAYLTVLANPLIAGVSLARIMKLTGVSEPAIQKINTAAREVARRETANDGVYESMLRASEIVPAEAAVIGEITGIIEKLLREKDQATLHELVYGLVMKETNLYQQALSDEEQQEPLLLRTFLTIVQDYEDIAPGATIGEFLEYCWLLSGFSVEITEQENADAVRVLTAHKSKGKEFPVVFITDLAYGRFPLRYQSKPFYVPNDLSKGLKTGDDEKKLFEQEERRLCYVAMTRAESRLYFTRAQWYGENKRETRPSQFLIELRYASNPLIQVVRVPAPAAAPEPVQSSPLEELKRKTQSQAKQAIDQLQFHTALQRLIELEKLRLIEKGESPAAFDPQAFFTYTEPDFNLAELAKGKPLPLIYDSHTFSASGLNMYADCPLRYKFQYVLLVPSGPKTYFSFGQVVHGVIEQLSKDRIYGMLVTKERALALLNAEWDSSAYPSKTQESEDRRKAEVLLDTFLAWQETNNNTIIEAEQRFQYRLNGRVIKGYIDRIEQQPDGGLVVIDFKSGSSKSAGITRNSIREDIQMNLYSIAVQEIYGKLPVRASLYYLADNKMIDYIPDPESIAAFKERVQGMIAAVCAEEFGARPSYMGCQRCDYVDLCEMAKGE